MKTWEMFKVLAENPKLTFKNLRTQNNVSISSTGHLSWEHTGEPYNYACRTGFDNVPMGWDGRPADGNWNDDWEQVQEPVDFMTAVKAMRDGKTVISKSKEFGTQTYKNLISTIVSPMGAVSIDEVLDGFWYIEP